MNVIVHLPKTPGQEKELCNRLAKIHVEYIMDYIEKMNLSTEQKNRLIDEIIRNLDEKTR